MSTASIPCAAADSTQVRAQLPIDKGTLFFEDANVALDFQGQLQAYGAITGRRKLPWRYRWPEAVRDDVLACLLALNADRYAEEVALELHSKAARAGETEPMQDEQIGLGL